MYTGNEVSEMLVAPLAGAWIEMLLLRFHARRCLVAPLAGAWIEIPGIS